MFRKGFPETKPLRTGNARPYKWLYLALPLGELAKISDF